MSCLAMDLMRSMHELAEKMDNEADIKAGMREINKLPHKLLILIMVNRRRVTPVPQLNVGINRSENWRAISHTSQLQEIHGVVLL